MGAATERDAYAVAPRFRFLHYAWEVGLGGFHQLASKRHMFHQSVVALVRFALQPDPRNVLSSGRESALLFSTVRQSAGAKVRGKRCASHR